MKKPDRKKRENVFKVHWVTRNKADIVRLRGTSGGSEPVVQVYMPIGRAYMVGIPDHLRGVSFMIKSLTPLRFMIGVPDDPTHDDVRRILLFMGCISDVLSLELPSYPGVNRLMWIDYRSVSGDGGGLG